MTETTSLPQKGTVPETREGLRGLWFTPRVDIIEMEGELTLYADLPGVRPGDVELRFEKGELILTGRVQPRHSGADFLLREYEVGNFSRTFAIHETIDGSKIEAEFKNGVLIVHLPKLEKVRPRQITVRSN